MTEKGRRSLYRPAYCDAVITHCRTGAHLASFAASIGVSRRTLFAWREAHEEFSQAVGKAREAAEAWRVEKAREIVSLSSRDITKMGRPSLYDPAYCDAIVAHCRTGASLTSFAASIGVSRRTIFVWGDAHEEFFQALEKAKAAAAAWYDEKARGIVGGASGSATLCMFGLKNFAPDDFRDVQERRHSGEVVLKKVIYAFVGDEDT